MSAAVKPRLLITMGDVAGIGPEVIAKAWPRLNEWCHAVVVGDPSRLPEGIPCVDPTLAKLSHVMLGRISAEAGQAAYDWLCYAIDECLAGRADGIVTCPLHKEGLHLAGVPHPGHTEILAERCGVDVHAMLLYDDELPLAVAHVTLHQSLRSAVEDVSQDGIRDKIRLLHGLIPRLTGHPARIGVMALNPHAGDGGLFGNEEAKIILPAIEESLKEKIDVIGPIPADAMFLPVNRTKVNGIVAMYHDQGHIPMKLIGGRRAVNVTAGLPIVRTSVAHGTAYDIAGKGIADESSLIAAVRVAAKLARSR
ncbi:MAG: 4-hydroxythreonine-4-phosphate dehydrogenase PdxA [Gemmataceae bacterium]